MRRFVGACILLSFLCAWVAVRPLPRGAGGSEAKPLSLSRGVVGSPTTSPAPEFFRTQGREGFWRIAQTTDGVWWYLSPTGEREFLNTVTTVQPYQHARVADGARYVSRDWTGNDAGGGDTTGGAGGDAVAGDLDAWADRTIQRVHAMGFKALGAWCNPVFHKHDIAMTRDLNIWSWMKPEFRRFYSPGWLTTAEIAVQQQCTPLKDNVNLVGYFIDNELDWGEGGWGPGYYFKTLPADDLNRRQVMGVIRKLWPTIEEFNAAWKVAISDFKQLDDWKTLPKEPHEPHAKLLSAWIEHVATDYFLATTT